MFCPKCGSILKVKKKDGKNAFYCEECKEFVSTEGKIKEKGSKEIREVTISKEEKEVHPKIKGVECPKCGNDEAYFWVVQTRAADEAPTRFYKCTKCGHVWREYD